MHLSRLRSQEHISEFITMWRADAVCSGKDVTSADWLTAFTAMTGMMVDSPCLSVNESQELVKKLSKSFEDGLNRYFAQNHRTLN